MYSVFSGFLTFLNRNEVRDFMYFYFQSLQTFFTQRWSVERKLLPYICGQWRTLLYIVGQWKEESPLMLVDSQRKNSPLRLREVSRRILPYVCRKWEEECSLMLVASEGNSQQKQWYQCGYLPSRGEERRCLHLGHHCIWTYRRPVGCYWGGSAFVHLKSLILYKDTFYCPLYKDICSYVINSGLSGKFLAIR